MSQIHTLKPGPRTLKVLRIDSSARDEGSMTRRIADALIAQLERSEGPIDLRVRDLASQPPRLLDPEWVKASFMPPEKRGEAERAALAESDALVAELKAADVLVIGVPIYNFGIPATLKAWVDLVARARLTFRYTEQGPVGLLGGKRAYLAVASGGVPVGSASDFATGYLRQVLGFLGIEAVEIVAADRVVTRGEDQALAEAQGRIARLLPGPEPLARIA